jgi:hypothetical protein
MRPMMIVFEIIEHTFYNRVMNTKVYVKVLAEFSPAGDLIPFRITWPDGREFPIDRILSVGPGVSPSGGSGTRYLCRIQGREVPLYFGAASRMPNDVWWCDGK